MNGLVPRVHCFPLLVLKRSRNGVALQKFIDDGKLPLLQQMYKDAALIPLYSVRRPGMEDRNGAYVEEVFAGVALLQIHARPHRRGVGKGLAIDH